METLSFFCCILSTFLSKYCLSFARICDENPAGDVAHSGAKCVTSCFVFHAAHRPDVWLSFVRRSQRLIFDTKKMILITGDITSCRRWIMNLRKRLMMKMSEKLLMGFWEGGSASGHAGGVN